MKLSRIAFASVAFVLGATLASAAPAQEPAQDSLYDRLGGLKGITVVVDDFVDRLVSNATLNSNPEIDAGRKRSPPAYLKFQISQMVCEATGGPCTYTGKSMKESHARMNITEAEWDVMAGEFQTSLDKFAVPATEQKELFGIVGTTKADIVAGAKPSK